MEPPTRSDKTSTGEYLGMVGDMTCYTCKLRGNLNDRDSNWRLWNADRKVFRDGAGKDEEDEVFESIDAEVMAKMERRRKAIVWFSISERIRGLHLTDMGGRDKTAEDVMKRMFDNFAPEGSKYSPLEKLEVEEHMRVSMRKAKELKRLEREAMALDPSD